LLANGLSWRNRWFAGKPAPTGATTASAKISSGGVQGSTRLGLVAMAVVATVACATLGPRGATAPPPRLLFTGHIEGYLEPCGCSEGQLGGVARRAELLRRLRAEPGETLLVDAGNRFIAGGDAGAIQATYLAKAAERAGVAAINLGLDERVLGADFLYDIEALRRLPWVRTNPPPSREGPWPGEPLRRLAVGDQRIAIAGISTVATRSEGTVPDPVAALRSVAAERAPEERLVVLVQGSLADADAIARAVPTIDVIVTADGGAALEPAAHTVGPVLVVATGTDGKWLGAITLAPGPLPAAAVTTFVLGEKIPDDPATAALVADYYGALKEARVLAEEPPQPTVGGAFTGAAACQSCHPDAYQVWQGSGHARALTTLVERGKDGAPECVTCHTLGHGFTGGFVDAQTTPERGGVQCESCHGVGSNHIANPSPDYGHAGEPTCRPCHTPEQSTQFDFETYWGRIFH